MSRIDPLSPPSIPLTDIGWSSVYPTELTMSVVKLNGFDVADLLGIRPKASWIVPAVNGIATMSQSLYEICSPFMVHIPLMGFSIR